MQKRGFTLVELLVVIAIIGILSSIGMVQLSDIRGKARNAKRITDAHAIETALTLYYDDFGTYPHVDCSTVWQDPDGSQNPDASLKWSALEKKLKSYLPSLPDDPFIKGAAVPNPAFRWSLVVSGAVDNFQHYILLVELEPSGARAILALPNALNALGFGASRSSETFRFTSTSLDPSNFNRCGYGGDSDPYVWPKIDCGSYDPVNKLYHLCLGKPETPQQCGLTPPDHPFCLSD